MNDSLMLTKENLIKIAEIRMPFGKYKGTLLIDLPEEYLLWFNRADKGFPNGELGKLMELTLMLKVDGLDHLVKPLRKANFE